MRWASLLRLNTSTTEQAAAQTPASPFWLHTITQTHHDEHNNYRAHMALRLHQLSMSTQKATEAGTTGWDNHGTKEWTARDGGNLHPLTHLPAGIFFHPSILTDPPGLTEPCSPQLPTSPWDAPGGSHRPRGSHGSHPSAPRAARTRRSPIPLPRACGTAGQPEQPLKGAAKERLLHAPRGRAM